jgi:hypothetical protein
VETTISGDSQEWKAGIATGGVNRELGEIGSNYGVMAALASETGGQVIQNSNDLSGAVGHAIDNGARYYTLSYTPTDNTMDGKFRSIQIKLAGSQYKLSYRQGYYALDSSAPEPKAKSKVKNVSIAGADAAARPLQQLMQRGAPSSTQILYAVGIQPANPQPAANAERAGDNTNLTGTFTRYTVDFLIHSKDLDLQTTSDGNRHGRVQIELVAYDRNGKALNWAGDTSKFNLKPETYASIEKSGMHAHMEIDVPAPRARATCWPAWPPRRREERVAAQWRWPTCRWPRSCRGRRALRDRRGHAADRRHARRRGLRAGRAPDGRRLRDWLLSDAATPRRAGRARARPDAGDGRGRQQAHAQPGPDPRRRASCRVVTRFRNTVGLPGSLSVRLQPNHPTDDPPASPRACSTACCYGAATR